MDDKNTIYADWAVLLLILLMEKRTNPMGPYTTLDQLADLLCIGDHKMLIRCLSPWYRRNGGGGWRVYEVGSRTERYSFTDHFVDALGEIAIKDYNGPREVAVETKTFFDGVGVSIDAVNSAASTLSDRWQLGTKYAMQDLDFQSFCDGIMVHLNAQNQWAAMGCPGENGYIGVDKFPRYLPSDFRPVADSPLSLVSFVLWGHEMSVSMGGVRIKLESDGLGAVDYRLPVDTSELASLVLPREALSIIACQDVMTSPGFEHARGELAEYFCGDAGHRFSTMVGRCMELLTPSCSQETMESRCDDVLRSYGKALSDAGRAGEARGVNTTIGVIRQYAGSSGARTLAALTLAIIVGPDRSDAIRSVVSGRWTR